MIDTIVLVFTLLIFVMIGVAVFRSIIYRRSIIGRPPIPVLFFILAKLLVMVNLAFLLFRGMKIGFSKVFEPTPFMDWIAVFFLILGTIILFVSAIQLNHDLIFGLSSSGRHSLQTRGIYSISRHPFYLGFICILFASCLLSPNLLNLAAFPGAWLLHHFIMIREEQFLISRYGEEYRRYTGKVKRYITL